MKKAPSPLVSLIPIIVLVLLLFATIRTFGSDALSGGSQVSLLTTTAICILIGMVFYKIPWKDYELAITNNIAGVATAIIILLIIGALSGIWMICTRGLGMPSLWCRQRRIFRRRIINKLAIWEQAMLAPFCVYGSKL